MLKSSLKTSSESLVRRQVTFCKTVEIYSYPSDCGTAIGNDNRDSESVDYVEEVTVERRDVEDNDLSENPEDFHVHKVVYNTFEELFPEHFPQDVCTDSDEGEPIVYYPTECESEVQEFVVHCVNQLEKEKSNKIEVSKNNPDSEEVCTLSIENIEQHNKLTESEIHIDTDLDCTNAMFGSTITLSPPLQDFGIEHLICPPSDKWFKELDISPLNSTQETDSGSNLSSEDTMIMMTSEECEKNEKRIQESLQKFESLKKLKSSTPENEEEDDQKWDFNALSVSSRTVSTDQITLSLDSLEIIESSLEQQYPNKNILTSCDQKQLPQVSSDENSTDSVLSIEKGESVDPPSNRSSVLLDDSLTSIEIPQDVREWKIDVKESRLSLDCGSSNSLDPDCDTSVAADSGASISLPDCTPDELESFVHECTERIERIKKRYSISDKPLWTPRRGIRPRFGSTAQIVQQIQNTDHSSVPNPHYSWPCYSSTDPETDDSYLLSPPELLQTNFCDLQSYDCPETTSLDASGPIKESWFPMSFSCDLKQNSPVLSERGVPEGSSPTPTSTESLLETKNQNEPHSLPSDGVIYYSMKV